MERRAAIAIHGGLVSCTVNTRAKRKWKAKGNIEGSR
jgi:hypothetical protein